MYCHIPDCFHNYHIYLLALSPQCTVSRPHHLMSPSKPALFTHNAPMAPHINIQSLAYFFSSVCQISGRNKHENDPQRAGINIDQYLTSQTSVLSVPNKQRRTGQG